MAETWRVLEDPIGGAPMSTPTVDTSDRPLTSARPGWLLLVAGIVIVVVAAIWLVVSGPSGTAVAVNAAHGVQASTPAGSSPARVSAGAATGALTAGTASPSSALFVVEVNGGVRRPGIVRMTPGARVGDAIAAAGGYSARVDAMAAQTVNLAAKVEDGEQIHVPVRGEGSTAAAAGSTGAGTPGARSQPANAAGPVNVNTATSAELEALPGIGPATAARIIAARATKPFSSVEDLRERKIVGSATLEKIRSLVVTH